jgi:ATP-binding cassette subfamily B protein
MLGHSTRLVQQTPNSFHDGEDDIVHRYSNAATRSDFLQIVARAVPRGFYLLSVVGVFFVLVASPHQAVLALTLGALALGVTALGSLGEILVAGAGLVALWRSLKPVVDDDVMMQERAHEAIADTGDDGKGHVVEMRGVGFAYRGRSRPVFDDLTLEIAQGERVLIEGRSGGGKTTLAALLAGLRKPSSGLVFVKGLDQHTISETQLRRIIASAPQFYRNHVFTESFAFNLLLGRNWPPAREDLQAATEVCHAVGLGPLLEQMPGGLFQHVGETGWKLSHGERSRVFLARTLLQTSECLILDETFGALDPTTLRQCMTTVLRRARTLVVITHR